MTSVSERSKWFGSLLPWLIYDVLAFGWKAAVRQGGYATPCFLSRISLHSILRTFTVILLQLYHSVPRFLTFPLHQLSQCWCLSTTFSKMRNCSIFVTRFLISLLLPRCFLAQTTLTMMDVFFSLHLCIIWSLFSYSTFLGILSQLMAFSPALLSFVAALATLPHLRKLVISEEPREEVQSRFPRLIVEPCATLRISVSLTSRICPLIVSVNCQHIFSSLSVRSAELQFLFAFFSHRVRSHTSILRICPFSQSSTPRILISLTHTVRFNSSMYIFLVHQSSSPSPQFYIPLVAILASTNDYDIRLSFLVCCLLTFDFFSFLLCSGFFLHLSTSLMAFLFFPFVSFLVVSKFCCSPWLDSCTVLSSRTSSGYVCE